MGISPATMTASSTGERRHPNETEYVRSRFPFSWFVAVYTCSSSRVCYRDETSTLPALSSIRKSGGTEVSVVPITPSLSQIISLA